MTILKQFIECMKKGDPEALAALFSKDGVLHDSSVIRMKRDTIHLEGRMAVEMMYRHRFGFNGGPFPISGVKFTGDNMVNYFITCYGHVIPAAAILTGVDGDGKIMRLNIYPV